jgi:plasmid replication initiation protein
MRKLLSTVFKWIGKIGEGLENPNYQKNFLEIEKTIIDEPSFPKIKKINGKKVKKREIEVISKSERSIRDFTEIMENPFVALSKKRKTPIIYESLDGTQKIKVTRHTGHFLASIYDWDIVLFVAGKMQEILNNGSDIPPRSMIIPRHEILEALHKHNVKKQQKDLENSLQRLKRTAIDTTIRNEDYRYKSDFGFVDSWEYTEREDKKEIKITLSQWLYDGICAKGSLLKVSPAYFCLTSALKRFLYRTARKHVGNNKELWEFTIEKLYEKSGSEREFKKFKSDLKTVVLENDIPDYSMKWIERNGKTIVAFRDTPSRKIEELIEEFKDSEQDAIEFLKEEILH